MTVGVGSNTVTYAPPSGTKVITTNGKTLDFPITVNAPGGTVQLADNFTLGSSRVMTHLAGLIDVNAKLLNGQYTNSLLSVVTGMLKAGT